MTGYAKLCAIVYWVALMAWLAVLVSAAVAAVSAFATLPETDITLHAYPEVDFADHGSIAAGMVTNPIFVFADVVQVACIVFALITLVLQIVVFKMPFSRPANWLRAAALIGATLVFGYRAVLIQPDLNADLRAYQKHLKSEQIELARQHKESFDAAHMTARHLYEGTFGLVLLAVAASAAAFVPNLREVNASGAVNSLQEPELSRQR